MIDIETYALAKAYTDKAIEGGGAIQGKNCIITEIEDVGNTHIVHFQWTLDDGTVETDTMTVEDGDLVEASETNGNIKINGVETQVYNDAEIKADIDAIDDIITTDESTVEGNPINFTTKSAQNAKSTILSCEPIQDLHGYDKPWPGGAGKNLLPLNLETIKSINTDGTWNNNEYTHRNVKYTINTDSDGNIISISANGQANANSTLALIQGVNPPFNNMILSHGGNGGSSNSFFMGYTKKTLPYTVFALAYSTEKTIEIPEGHETDDYFLYIRVANGYNAQNVILYPMVRASGTSTTFEPYTNICPISGRTEIGILGWGKNLMNTFVPQTNVPTTITENKGTYSITPATQGQGGGGVFINYKVIKNKTYTLSFNIVSGNIINVRLYKYTTSAAQDEQIQSLDISGGTFTALDDGYIRFWIGASDTLVINNVQLEENNQQTPYSPYTESNPYTDLTIQFGQTVYGGTLDVENGVLVVDREIITLDGSNDESWLTNTISSGKRRFICQNLPITGYTERTTINHYNNLFKATSSSEWELDNNITILRYANAMRIDVLTEVFGDSLQAFTDYLGTHNMQVCYKLFTPITINLTPHTIKLLEGVNNISTDGDKITLTYRDGSVATLGDLTSAVDNLDSKIDESKILTDTATGDKYILVVTNGVLSVEQVSD